MLDGDAREKTRFLRNFLNRIPAARDSTGRKMKRPPEQIAEELLVMRSQEGSRASMELLLKKWRPRLWLRAIRLTGDREAASDVVQESLLAMAKGIRGLQDPAGFGAWAYRIVSNKSRDWIRKRVRDRKTLENYRDSLETAATDSEDARKKAIREAIERLPEIDREILRHHYHMGFSVGEIAKIESIPEGTVKSRLFHARNRLKGELAKQTNNEAKS